MGCGCVNRWSVKWMGVGWEVGGCGWGIDSVWSYRSGVGLGLGKAVNGMPVM